MHDDMVSGKFRNEQGKPFTAFTTRMWGGIVRLHNGLAGRDTRFTRELVSQRRYAMFTYFRSLTPTTQEALVWFVQNATKAKSRRHGTRRVIMTEATRSRGIEAIFGLLRQLDVNGIELVDHKVLKPLLATPDHGNSEYRSIARDVHDARPVYRCCIEQGFLTENPLEGVPDDRFDEHAKRDFIVPTDLDKLLDLGSIDMADDQQVRDRLVCLIYVDTGLRRDELASLKLDQVRRNDKGYWLHLKPENQKGQKPAKSLPLLYDSSEKLLAHYLKAIRPKHGGDAFIIDSWGKAASGVACAAAVRRETDRLGIKTYLDADVSPHCLRRTFGTCNVNPLGLGLDIAYIAGRLRNGIDITYRHYMQDNPLLQEQKATEIKTRNRKTNRGMDRKQVVHVLSAANVDPELVTAVERDMLERAEAERRSRSELGEVKWISEKDALTKLEQEWGVRP